MHEETGFDRKKLRKTRDEYYVEQRTNDADDSNLVVSVTGISRIGNSEQAKMILSQRRIICD